MTTPGDAAAATSVPGDRSRHRGAVPRLIRAVPGRLRRRQRKSGWTPDPRPARAGMTSGEGLTSVLAGLRYAALTAIAVLVTTASLVSLAESYRGLYEWAARHGVTGIWVVIWPLMVDVFIAIGELALLVGLTDQWPARSRAGAWAVTLCGLAVSVSGNVGHVASHSPADRGTAVVPPLAAAFSLAVGMGVLKRVVQARAPVTAPPGPQAAPQQLPATGLALNGNAGPAASRPGAGRPT